MPFPASQRPGPMLPFPACPGLIGQKKMSYMLEQKRNHLEGKFKWDLNFKERVLSSAVFERTSPSLISLPFHQRLFQVPPYRSWSYRSEHAGFTPECSRYESQILQRGLLIAKCTFQSRSPEQEAITDWAAEKVVSGWLALGPVSSREINTQRNQHTSLTGCWWEALLSSTCCKSPPNS